MGSVSHSFSHLYLMISVRHSPQFFNNSAMQHVNENGKAWTLRSNPNSSGFKLKITVLSLLIFFLLFHLWKIDFSRLCLLKCPHLQLTACFNLCICSSIPPTKPHQISTWEPPSHTHRWSSRVSEILSLPRYDEEAAPPFPKDAQRPLG